MPRGDKKTDSITFRVEPDILSAIEKEAEKEDRALAAMARILVKEALAAREKKKGKKKPA